MIGLNLGLTIGRGGGIYVPDPVLRYIGDAASLTKDGANLIGQVNDLGTTGKNLTQAVANNKALWVDDASPNVTKDVIRCVPNTNGKWVSSTSGPAVFSAASGFTVFVAFKETSAIFHPLFLHNNGSVRGGWQLEFNTGPVRRQMQARTSAGIGKSATFGNYTDATPEIWCVANWGGGSDDVASDSWFITEVNGSNVAWSGTPWFWVPTGAFLTLVGNNISTTGPTTDIHEARAYAAYLNAAQRLQVARELGSLYGITTA